MERRALCPLLPARPWASASLPEHSEVWMGRTLVPFSLHFGRFSEYRFSLVK